MSWWSASWRLLLVVIAWFLAGFAAGHLVFAHDHPEPQYCRSVTEDGPIVNCDYHGDTNTWEPR